MLKPTSCCLLILLFWPTAIKKIEGTADAHVTPSELKELLRLEQRLLNLCVSAGDEDHMESARLDLQEILKFSDDPTAHPLAVLSLYVHWSSHDFEQLKHCPVDEVKEFVSQLPSPEDLEAVAGHVLRLCVTYNLPVSHVVDNGSMMGLTAVRPMNMKECFLVADTAYQMIDAKEHEKWHLACQKIAPVSKEEISFRQSKIDEFPGRQKIIGLLTSSASSKKQSEEGKRIVQMLTQHLSTEAYQNILSRSNNAKAADNMYEAYRRLCRQSLSDTVVVSPEDSGLHCFTDPRNFAKVELLNFQPVVALFHDILSPKERNDLMSAAIQSDLQVPKTVSARSGQIKSDVQKRTGKMAFITDDNDDNHILARVKAKTSHLSGLEVAEEDATEPLQVVNYGIGGHYEPHVDFFVGHNTTELLQGDRVATMLFYLGGDKVVGGATVFPYLNLAVRPQAGTALFWYNTHRGRAEGGGGDAATLHAGCPVLYGTKWIANLWIREKSQVFVRPCQAF